MNSNQYKITEIEVIELHLSLLEFFLRYMFQEGKISNPKLKNKLAKIQNELLDLVDEMG